MKNEILRIVAPALIGSDSAMKTQGTKVFCGEHEVSGVYKIHLYADTNDIWRAEIHCFPKFEGMSALSRIYRPTWWQRFKVWIKGAWSQVDMTAPRA